MPRINDAACDCQPLAPPVCGFQAFGMMPPCVLDPGHTEDHADGFGGHYANVPPDYELVQVAGTKELRYQKITQRDDQLVMFGQAPLLF